MLRNNHLPAPRSSRTTVTDSMRPRRPLRPRLKTGKLSHLYTLKLSSLEPTAWYFTRIFACGRIRPCSGVMALQGQVQTNHHSGVPIWKRVQRLVTSRRPFITLFPCSPATTWPPALFLTRDTQCLASAERVWLKSGSNGGRITHLYVTRHMHRLVF